MTHALRKGAIIYSECGNKQLHIGFLLPTPNAEPVVNPKTEIVMDVYTSTNMRKLKTDIMESGKHLSQEDGIQFLPAF